MALRSGEAPMDFQYDNKSGQVDPNSLFLRGSQSRPFGQSQSLPHSFSSSSKPFTFNSDLPKPAFQTPAKTTIHKSSAFTGTRENTAFDFSSGPENVSSPENADNDETPEVPKRLISENVTLARGSQTPSKSAFSNFSNLRKRLSFARSDLPRKAHGGVVARRAHKRKRRELERDDQLYRRSSHETDSDERPSSRDDLARRSSPTGKVPSEVGTLPAMLTFIHNHPHLPRVLMGYLQVVWNMLWIAALLYLVYTFWSGIRRDVDLRQAELEGDVLREMALCAGQYSENRCGRDTRVPAMETICNSWEKCMQQDPKLLGRAKISAHTFAEILSAFVDSLSRKLIGFFFITLVILFVVPNWLLSHYKNSMAPQYSGYAPPPPPPQHYMHSPYKQQQQQHLDFPNDADLFYSPQRATRFYHDQPVLEQRELDRDRDLGRQSPTRRIAYN